jgi:hypothetical protein
MWDARFCTVSCLATVNNGVSRGTPECHADCYCRITSQFVFSSGTMTATFIMFLHS